MPRTLVGKPISILAAAATLFAAAAALVAVFAAGPAAGQTPNLRPICNNFYFNPPSNAGQSVIAPAHQFAADPDVTPIKLVSAFASGGLGTVKISGNDLVFTRTSSSPGATTIYWTISDGTLQAQCQASASAFPPPPNG